MSARPDHAPSATLYSRPDCHLCDEARVLVQQALAGAAGVLTEIYIDNDPALRARYDTRVPVLAVGGTELDWPFDLAAARRLLGAG